MHLSELTIRNFRCFEKLTFKLHPQVNVFVGNNGSGKTAILDAIAGAMFPYVQTLAHMTQRQFVNPPLFYTDIRIGEKNKSDLPSEVSFEVLLDSEYEHKSKSSSSWNARYVPSEAGSGPLILASRKKELGDVYDLIHRSDYRNGVEVERADPAKRTSLTPIAYYSGARNATDQSNISSKRRPVFHPFEAFVKALNASASYDEMAEWFFFRDYEELQQGRERDNRKFQLRDLKQIRKAVSKIVKPDSRIHFNTANTPKLVVQWKTITGEIKEFSLGQLSDGYRNMLALVMDFARRMSLAHPNMENPLEGPGILMIDELDLHLHPTWQQRVIPDLISVFPNTQIIVTTHSPEIVTTVRREHVHVLDEGRVHPCPSPTFGMDTSHVVRHVLGLQALRPDNEISRKIRRLYDAIDEGDLVTAKKLRSELHEWDPNRFDTELTRADCDSS